MSNISEEQLIQQLSMSKNRVTPLEMTKYYNHRKIDFPKNKDGNPNMRYSQNKNTYQMLYRRKIGVNVRKRKRSLEPLEKYFEYQRDSIKEECIICFEPLNKDVVILECQHKYCVSCSLKHFRTKNNCPLCQRQIIDVNYPNTNIINSESFSDSEINEIINQEINYFIDEHENKFFVERIISLIKGLFNIEGNLAGVNKTDLERLSQDIISRLYD